MKDYKTIIHKFLHGLMTETEEKEFLKKLSSDPEFKEMAAIEALLYKHCNIASSSNKELTDNEKKFSSDCLPFLDVGDIDTEDN